MTRSFLITGGAGFVGINLTRFLLAKGQRVIPICRGSAQARRRIKRSGRIDREPHGRWRSFEEAAKISDGALGRDCLAVENGAGLERHRLVIGW